MKESIDMHIKLMKNVLMHIGFFVLLLIIMSVSGIVMFHITNYIFEKINWYPNEFGEVIINLLGANTLFFISISLIGSLMKGNERARYDDIRSTLKRMASGDFSARITGNFGGDNRHPMANIINDINYAAGELNEIEKMRQEFISNVSHEIQSPLTSIKGFARVLKENEMTEEQREHYLSIIEVESERLSKISTNLLKLTSLESEHHPVEMSKYRLDKQLINIILACEPQWMEKDIELDIEVEELEIVADKDLMSQVFMNVLSNSIKFTNINGTIRVASHIENSNIIVVIKDSGIGLSDIEKDRIFERFYKADSSRTVSMGGSGLGLSIVKKIIDIHDGSITVESEVGVGTKMSISIPLKSKYS